MRQAFRALREHGSVELASSEAIERNYRRFNIARPARQVAAQGDISLAAVIQERYLLLDPTTTGDGISVVKNDGLARGDRGLGLVEDHLRPPSR